MQWPTYGAIGRAPTELREHELGLGDTESRGDDAGEMGESLPPVDVGF